MKDWFLGSIICQHLASLMMPSGDPQDRFFYPTLTLIDSYIEICFSISDPTADFVPVLG